MTTAARGGSAALQAYVLHSWDWSETSLIVELLTREQGRIAVVAKGARRPTSHLRAVLLPFQRIHVTLTRPRAQPAGVPADPDADDTIRTLRGAEWGGQPTVVAGESLFAGFYLNELLLRLLPRGAPAERIHDLYAQTLPALQAPRAGTMQELASSSGAMAALAGTSGGEAAEPGRPAANAPSIERSAASGTTPPDSDLLVAETGAGLRLASALRAFELMLLRELGVLPDLRHATLTTAPLDPDSRYALRAESGVIASGDAAAIPGHLLIQAQDALDADRLDTLQRLALRHGAAWRTQLRALLHYHLGTSRLRSREVAGGVQRLLAGRREPNSLAP